MLYIAAPYSKLGDGQKHDVMRIVSDWAIELARKHVLCYSPLTYSSYMQLAEEIAYHNTIDDAYWRTHGLKMLSGCDALLVLQIQGWEESVGVQAEIEHAMSEGKPIYQCENKVVFGDIVREELFDEIVRRWGPRELRATNS